MTIKISTDRSSRSVAWMAARWLVPIGASSIYAGWRGHPAIALVEVALPLVIWSVWLAGRGNWKEIRVEETALSLVSDKTTVVIVRDAIVKLQLRDPAVIIKWRAQPKDRVAILVKVSFTPDAWSQLRAGLESWVR